MAKNLVLGPILVYLAPIQATNFFFKNLAFSVTRYHSQLSSCTISEKSNDPIKKKLSDGRTDRQTNKPMERRTRVISQDAVRLTLSTQNDNCVNNYLYFLNQRFLNQKPPQY